MLDTHNNLSKLKASSYNIIAVNYLTSMLDDEFELENCLSHGYKGDMKYVSSKFCSLKSFRRHIEVETTNENTLIKLNGKTIFKIDNSVLDSDSNYLKYMSSMKEILINCLKEL